MREPGQEFLAEAKRKTIVVSQEGLLFGSAASTPLLKKLTPLEMLDREIPVRVDGTPYAYFSSVFDFDQGIVVVIPSDENLDRVFREVALGMMDNLVYR